MKHEKEGDTMYEEIVDLISQVGFPIMAYFLMVVELSKLRVSHTEEMKEVMKVVEANTEAIMNLKNEVQGWREK